MKKFILFPLLVLLFSLSLVLPAFAVTSSDFVYIPFNKQSYTTQTSAFDSCVVSLYGNDGKFLIDLVRAESGITWQSTCYVTGNINSSGTGNFNLEVYLSDYINIYGKTLNVDFQRSYISSYVWKDIDGNHIYYNYGVPQSTYTETTSYGNIRISPWTSLSHLKYFSVVIPVQNYKYPSPSGGSGSQFDSLSSSSKYSGWYAFLQTYIIENKNIASNHDFPQKPTVINLFVDCSFDEFVRYEAQYNKSDNDIYHNNVINGTDSQNQQASDSRVNTDNSIDKIVDAGNALNSYVPSNINANDYTFSSITDGLNVNNSLSIFTNILNQPFVLQICLIVFSLMLIGFIFFGER